MNNKQLKKGQEVWTKAIVVKAKPDNEGGINLETINGWDLWVKPEEIMIGEQEIPQFVAGWIKYAKETSCSLRGTISFDELDTYNYANWSRDKVELISWMSDEENQEIFAKAWLFGYKVEQAQLYTVVIPNPNIDKNHVSLLMRSEDDKIALQTFTYPQLSRSIFHFTEDEIKEDFEWAWDAGFAKPVEEK